MRVGGGQWQGVEAARAVSAEMQLVGFAGARGVGGTGVRWARGCCRGFRLRAWETKLPCSETQGCTLEVQAERYVLDVIR